MNKQDIINDIVNLRELNEEHGQSLVITSKVDGKKKI